MLMQSQQQSDTRFAVPLGVSTISMLQYYVSLKLTAPHSYRIKDFLPLLQYKLSDFNQVFVIASCGDALPYGFSRPW